MKKLTILCRMINQKFTKSWFAFTLLLALGLFQATILNASTTTNLLINGDAEQQRCTNDWTAETSVPGWKVLRGAVSVLCYTAFTTANESPVLPANGQPGTALFAAPGADSVMEQTVDISPAAEAVDTAKVGYTLSAWLGGWRDLPESATLTAVFLDGNGNSTGTPVMLANADNQARGNVTALLSRQASGVLPPLTRKIVVTVNFMSSMTSFHNAYADNISLVLNGTIGSLLSPASLSVDSATVPRLDHVYVVMMENTNYADVFNTSGTNVTVTPQMPFLASLAKKGVLLTNMWGTYHPSDQNYVAMVAGDTFEYGAVYFPFNLTASHIGDLLQSSGQTWGGYVQNMGTPCNLVSYPNGGWYSPDDEPFSQFQDVINNPTICSTAMRDLTDFESAITNNSLPNFAWLAADGYNDGEGAWYNNFSIGESLSTQDAFLQSTFAPLFNSAAWKNSKSLLVITWDESQSWGWPDNHVATLLIGSPGLLKQGVVLDHHYNGYSVLKTIENALGLPTLDRFDTYANVLDEIFQGSNTSTSQDLLPISSVSTRGSINDTFGQVTTPAAVIQGQPVQFLGPQNLYGNSVVSIAPFGQVPSATSVEYQFNSGVVSIPTSQLTPGLYGAWLERGEGQPYRAPIEFRVLPAAQVTASSPGIEIVGAPAGLTGPLEIRQGSNLIVRYCLPSAAASANGWIGIFPAGTAVKKMTQTNANTISNWLKTPGYAPGKACGEAEAFVSELTPGTKYIIHLFVNGANGTPSSVGSSAAFKLINALP